MSAKRGRARGGKASFTFDVKSVLGDEYQKNPVDSSEHQGPPDTYPAMHKMPMPLKVDSTETSKSTIRQEIVDRCRNAFYLSPSIKQHTVDKYRNRYKEKDIGQGFISMLHPKTKDLLLGAKLQSNKSARNVKPKVTVPVKRSRPGNDKEEGVADESLAEANGEEKDSDEEKQISEDEEVEDEEEQITDYVSSYFDNGEDYLDDEDDNMDDGQAW